jgi:hypothetical protein
VSVRLSYNIDAVAKITGFLSFKPVLRTYNVNYVLRVRSCRTLCANLFDAQKFV